MTTTTVTMPDELYNGVKAIAQAEHRSANATIVVAVATYVRDHDKRSAIRAIGAEIVRKHGGLINRLAQ